MSTLFHLTNAKYRSHALTLCIAYNTKLPNIAIVLLLSVTGEGRFISVGHISSFNLGHSFGR